MNSLVKFWSKCKFNNPPYIHPADAKLIKKKSKLFEAEVRTPRQFIKSQRFGDFNDRRFHLSLYPVPYLGRLDTAKIVVLLLNPGFGFSDYITDQDAQHAKRREELINSLTDDDFENQYETADPQPYNKYSFSPGEVGADYLAWPKLPDLAGDQPINGLMEKRGGALISIDQAELISRLKNYYDKSIDWDGYKLSRMPLAKNAARFDAKNAREKVIAKEKFDPQRVVRYFVRPFDIRYAYYTGIRPIWNEPRPQLWTQYVTGNRFVVSRPARVADPEGVPLCLTRCLGDNDAFRGHAYYIPVRKHHDAVGMLAGSSTENLSNRTRAYLKSLGYSDPDQDPTAAEVIWLHALAIGFSQRYRVDNADGLTIGWPRIPLPNGRDALDASTTLGRRLAALLDTENEVPGVTIGNVAEQYRILGTISASDLMVSAGWGRAGSKGSVSPGPGKVMARDWTKVEHDALEAGFTAAKIDSARGFELLGQPNDVFLNGDTYWRAVPEQVWEFYIGGYQVIKEMAVVS